MKKRVVESLVMLAVAVVAGGCFFSRAPQLEIREYAPELRPASRMLTAMQIGSVVNLSGSGREFVIRKKNGRVICDESRRWLIAPEQMLKNAMLLFSSSTGADRVSAEILKFEFSSDMSELSTLVRFRVRSENSRNETCCVAAVAVKVNDGDYGRSVVALWEKLLNETFNKDKMVK